MFVQSNGDIGQEDRKKCAYILEFFRKVFKLLTETIDPLYDLGNA